MYKCKLCDKEAEIISNNIPLCKKHYELKNEIEEQEKQHLTLDERRDINKITFLNSEIKKRTGLTDLTEAIGKLTDKEYRATLAVMYRKPHYFKEYVIKNLINQSKPF